MVVNRRRKVGKYRGHSNHGGGMRKKRRGAGSRGGRGRAGTGKRAGHKKAGLPSPQLGQTGFIRRRLIVPAVTLNVGDLTLDYISHLVKDGKATKQGDKYVINLAQLGFDKLLGAGNTSLKLQLHITTWSASAEEKIKAAGGSLASSEMAAA